MEHYTPVKENGEKADTTFYFTHFVSSGYLNVCKIKCVDSTFFTDDDPSWNQDKVIINQTAARNFGLSNPVGQTICYTDGGRNEMYKIIGVTQDLYERTKDKAAPTLYFYRKTAKSFVYRYKPGLRAAAESKITELMKDKIHGQVLRFTYMEDMVINQNKTDVNFLNLLYILSFVCIVGSMFGIYSMVSLACECHR